MAPAPRPVNFEFGTTTGVTLSSPPPRMIEGFFTASGKPGPGGRRTSLGPKVGGRLEGFRIVVGKLWPDIGTSPDAVGVMVDSVAGVMVILELAIVVGVGKTLIGLSREEGAGVLVESSELSLEVGGDEVKVGPPTDEEYGTKVAGSGLSNGEFAINGI